MVNNHANDKPPEIFTSKSLPDPGCRARGESIVVDSRSEEHFSNYFDTLDKSRALRVPIAEGCLRGIVLFFGPPGCGKSCLAEGLANDFAERRFAKDGKRTTLFEIHASRAFSHMLGMSARAVDASFETVSFAARHGPVVLLMNEMESFAVNRRALSGGDPSDVQRVTNTILTRTDALSESSNVFVVGTSNFDGMVDLAFLDRADLIIEVGYPDSEAARSILERTARAFAGVGRLAANAIDSFISDNYGNETSPRLSGRTLRRIVPLSFVMYSRWTLINAKHLSAVAKSIAKRSKCNGDS